MVWLRLHKVYRRIIITAVAEMQDYGDERQGKRAYMSADKRSGGDVVQQGQ